MANDAGAVGKRPISPLAGQLFDAIKMADLNNDGKVDLSNKREAEAAHANLQKLSLLSNPEHTMLRNFVLDVFDSADGSQYGTKQINKSDRVIDLKGAEANLGKVIPNMKAELPYTIDLWARSEEHYSKVPSEDPGGSKCQEARLFLSGLLALRDNLDKGTIVKHLK